MVHFLSGLRRWEGYIIRFSYCTTLTISRDGRDVKVVAGWDGGEYVRRYTPEEVFGYIGTRPPKARKRVCKYVDDIILEILQKRGVKK